MPTAKDLETKAQALSYSDVVVLWDLVSQGKPTPGWAAGKALEYLLIQAFRLEGTEVTWPYGVKYPELKTGTMEQIDGAVHIEGVSFLIECKDESKKVSVEPLAKLRLRLQKRPPGSMGMIVSMKGYTKPASIFAQFSSPLNVLLWEKSDVDYGIRKKKLTEGLVEKYRWATLHGLPDLQLGV